MIETIAGTHRTLYTLTVSRRSPIDSSVSCKKKAALFKVAGSLNVHKDLQMDHTLNKLYLPHRIFKPKCCLLFSFLPWMLQFHSPFFNGS